MASKSATGIPALAAGHVHHVDQQAAAVDMAQEVVAQARALAGTLNDAGDVGHDEGDALVHPHDAQVGIQGGEVVVGDFGLGLGYHAQKGGFAHVGEAHQPTSASSFSSSSHVVALAGQTRLGKAGHLPGGGGKVHVAPAAPAAPGTARRARCRTCP